jgi:pyruvate formate lyase activating enzyme
MSILGRKRKKGGPREALFWSTEKSKVLCELCPHLCKIADGKRGICGVRENRDGKLYTLIYGKATSITPDPIEKKPLFHFHPGTDVLSFGTVGCNMKCAHCQNWSISQVKYEDISLRDLDAQDIPALTRRHRCKGIAWTYNEPIIWFEFALDGCKVAKKSDLYTVFVSNGFIEREPLKMISPYLDAMNIDVKAFNEEHYKKVCKARLSPVLDTVKNAKEFGIFVELTYLIVPSQNDSEEEIEAFCEWASGIDREIPLHFSRFHPDYKMTSIQPTPMETMEKAYELAKENGMKYAYLGNIMPGDRWENTYCPKCNELLVERWGFNVRVNNMDSKNCRKCGETINMRI